MVSKTLSKTKQLLEQELENNERVIIARFKSVTRNWRSQNKGLKNDEEVKSLLSNFIKRE